MRWKIGGRVNEANGIRAEGGSEGLDDVYTCVIEGLSTENTNSVRNLSLSRRMSNTDKPYVYVGHGEVPIDVVHIKIDACVTLGQ